MTIIDQIKELKLEDMALFLCQADYTCTDCSFDNDQNSCLEQIEACKGYLLSEEQLFEDRI